jgi:hypothetical protein
VLLLGVTAVVLTGSLVRSALPDLARFFAMALAALCPAMVAAGALATPQALAVPLCALLALLLASELAAPSTPSRPRELGLAGTSALLLASDWSAWPPVLAWLGWLLAFRPEWLDRTRAMRAALPLLLGLATGAALGAFLLLHGADPRKALGGEQTPLGAGAVLLLLDGLGAPWLGLGRASPVPLRIGVAVCVVLSMVAGHRRAWRGGAGPWASVLVVGSAGAWVPALAIHPWIPVAADKNLWYMAPLVIALSLAAMWPIGRWGDDAASAGDGPGRAGRRPAGLLPAALGVLRNRLYPTSDRARRSAPRVASSRGLS